MVLQLRESIPLRLLLISLATAVNPFPIQQAFENCSVQVISNSKAIDSSPFIQILFTNLNSFSYFDGERNSSLATTKSSAYSKIPCILIIMFLALGQNLTHLFEISNLVDNERAISFVAYSGVMPDDSVLINSNFRNSYFRERHPTVVILSSAAESVADLFMPTNGWAWSPVCYFCEGAEIPVPETDVPLDLATIIRKYRLLNSHGNGKPGLTNTNDWISKPEGVLIRNWKELAS